MWKEDDALVICASSDHRDSEVLDISWTLIWDFKALKEPKYTTKYTTKHLVSW